MASIESGCFVYFIKSTQNMCVLFRKNVQNINAFQVKVVTLEKWG